MMKYDFFFKLGNGAELTVKVEERDYVRAGEKGKKRADKGDWSPVA